MTSRNRKNATYYINEEKRTVVCVISKCGRDFYEFLSEMDDKRPQDYVSVYNGNLHMAHEYVGIARCAPEDTFDAEKGKLIAFNRAKRKYDLDFFHKAQTFIDHLDGIMDAYCAAINHIGMRFAENAERRKQEIEDM